MTIDHHHQPEAHEDDEVARIERERVERAEQQRAERADAESAADDVHCGHIEDGDECGAERLLYLVKAPERGLDALIPDPGVVVCDKHLTSVLVDQPDEDNRAWSVTVIAEPA